MLSEAQSINYVHIPRTAGNYTQKQLKAASCRPGNNFNSTSHDVFLHKGENHLRFGTIRNPFDHIYSYFKFHQPRHDSYVQGMRGLDFNDYIPRLVEKIITKPLEVQREEYECLKIKYMSTRPAVTEPPHALTPQALRLAGGEKDKLFPFDDSAAVAQGHGSWMKKEPVLYPRFGGEKDKLFPFDDSAASNIIPHVFENQHRFPTRLHAPLFLHANHFLWYYFFEKFDFVVRFEDLDNGLEIITRSLGRNNNYERKEKINTSRSRGWRGEEDYRKAYNNKSIELIQLHCKKILTYFRYDFEGPTNKRLLRSPFCTADVL